MALLSIWPKQPQPKKKAAKGGKGKGTTCFIHKKYGADAWKCADPTTCIWSEN